MPKIHQEVTFSAKPAQVYRALMDSAEHTRFTGDRAEIDATEGGRFSCYGGRVQGRNLRLVPDKDIVQAWRAADWPEAMFTVARFELRAEGDRTRLVFEQDAVPDSAVEHLEAGWKRMYWEPLRKHLEA